jgi:Tfp pilus assembly protein FimT
MRGRMRDAEAGVTLVELIIYVVIAALVTGLMAGIFINGLHSQTAATDRDTATGKAGVVTSSLQQSLRNATTVSPATGTTNTLIAVVATGTSSWQCRAWALTATGDLVYKSSSSAFSVVSTAGWTVLAKNVTGSFTGGKVFSVTSTTQVRYGFSVSVSASTVPITGAVTTQAAMTGAGPCW